jgi:signal transduction histidine kinase
MSKEKAMFFRWSKICLLFVSSVSIAWLHAMLIHDHGAGMDKGTVENMFIPFYSNKNNGTGLGMPIAKKIIEGHEGTIDIESHPGTGTEVLIRLPYRSGNQ